MTADTAGSAQADAAAQRKHILVVEDEKPLSKAIAKRFRKAGYTCEVADSLAAAHAELADTPPDLILLDLRLPDGSGLDFLETLRTDAAGDTPVVVMTAYGELDDAVAALKLKALDYIKKPVDLDELVLTLEKVLRQAAVSESLAHSRQRDDRALEGHELLGDSPAMQRVREQIRRVGELTRCGDAEPPTVLILGETGCGKDLAAKLLHRHSARRERPFVHVDCAGLPKDLIESELFGHEKGAFTGAHAARTGLIVTAEDGTVFLDEVAELPLELQSKLLGVLERHSVRRVGASKEHAVGAWFVAATNRDLESMVKEAKFRADLYFRLEVLTLTMPPLRARADDVVTLARHFAQATARRYGFAEPELEPALIESLQSYAWPGNVRELKHLVERAVMLSAGKQLSAADLSLEASRAPEPREHALDSAMTLEAAEHRLIAQALERTGGNVSEAARQLGITRMALRYRMQKYDLAPGR